MDGLSIVELGLDDARLREFVRLPWRLNRGDPNWTPPLNAEYLGSRILGMEGLLTAAHPYHEDAEVTHFLAHRGTRAVGRISAAINHRFNRYQGLDNDIGSFGFMEFEQDFEVASTLLDCARDWLIAHGAKRMRGPGEYSNATHERQGVLIDGFETPPTMECTHNPPLYGEYLERWGLSKVKDYHAYLIDIDRVPAERLARVAEQVRARHHVETRRADLRHFGEEIGRVIDVYNQAWAANWGFLPLTQDEAKAVAAALKPIVDPGLVRFATIDGETVAVLGAFPDPNWALRPRWGLLGDSDPVRLARLMAMRRHIPRVRLMFFGIVPGHRAAGLDALLFDETYRYALTRGYKTIEASLLLEDNDMILRPSASLGGERYKTWRIYEREIG